MPVFAANLSFLWTELPFLDRFAAARDAGFSRVEYMFPYEHPAHEVRDRLDGAGLEQVLFNLPAGDWLAGDRGIAADPQRTDEFRAGVEQALDYAEVLEVEQLNCLAGLQLDGVELAEQRATLVGNVRFAARRLADQGLRLLVEPVNTYDVAGFLIPTTCDALRLLDDVGEVNVMLQFDAYHVQRMEGNPAARLDAVLDWVGHVQVADDPGRHQPGTGTIDFPALFAVLQHRGYQGSVGLEYIPEPDTARSLDWLEWYGLAPSERS
ncbi:MAG: hyi1 [Solirubrobacterales bacterium]|nr:hyi1 [Solirubrobacterales bacterium]